MCNPKPYPTRGKGGAGHDSHIGVGFWMFFWMDSRNLPVMVDIGNTQSIHSFQFHPSGIVGVTPGAPDPSNRKPRNFRSAERASYLLLPKRSGRFVVETSRGAQAARPRPGPGPSMTLASEAPDPGHAAAPHHQVLWPRPRARRKRSTSQV